MKYLAIIFTCVMLVCGLFAISPLSNVSASASSPVVPTQISKTVSLKRINVFANEMAFSLPKTWKQAFHQVEGNMASFEFIPQASSMNQWQEMLCIQGFKGMGQYASPEVFLGEIVNSYKHNCQGELIYDKLGDTLVDNQEAFHGLVSCSRLPFMHQGLSNQDTFESQIEGEVGYFSVARLGDDLLMLHKSMRGASFSQDNIPLTKDSYPEFITELKTLTLTISDE